MTVVSTMYDAFVTRLGALLPDHRRLPNPYDIEENSELYLKQGWGLAVAGLENTNRSTTCNVSTRVTFEIPITRKYFALEHDAVSKGATDKALLEDLQLIIDDAQKNNLGATSSTHIAVFLTAGGVSSIRVDDEDKFRELRATLTAEYFT